jgi:hypothetical protein
VPGCRHPLDRPGDPCPECLGWLASPPKPPDPAALALASVRGELTFGHPEYALELAVKEARRRADEWLRQYRHLPPAERWSRGVRLAVATMEEMAQVLAAPAPSGGGER